jgi:hypothetical protein
MMVASSPPYPVSRILYSLFSTNLILRKDEHRMSTHPISDLLSLWAKGDLTPDQAIGHILQNLLALSQRLAALEKAQAQRGSSATQSPAAPPAT